MNENLVCCDNCQHLEKEEWLMKPQCCLQEGVLGYVHAEPSDDGEAYILVDDPENYFCKGFIRKDDIVVNCNDVISSINKMVSLIGSDIKGQYTVIKKTLKHIKSDEMVRLEMKYDIKKVKL